jgi:hypothetical protein
MKADENEMLSSEARITYVSEELAFKRPHASIMGFEISCGW